jgi:hypothetical protein
MAKIIRVTADRSGLTRAGIDHPEGITDYPREDLTDLQVEHLKLEAFLVVEEIDDEAPTAPVKGGSKAKSVDPLAAQK